MTAAALPFPRLGTALSLDLADLAQVLDIDERDDFLRALQDIGVVTRDATVETLDDPDIPEAALRVITELKMKYDVTQRAA